MKQAKFGAVLASAILCCGAGASAQKAVEAPQVAAPSGSVSGPITLNVVVTDKRGHPIGGLKQEDFTLLDNKQPATIRSFTAHAIATEPADSQALILLIDNVNVGFNAVSIERAQIEDFLRSNGGHLAIPAGIFQLTDNGLEQITPISKDGNTLASGLHQKDGQLRSIERSAGFYGAEERAQLSVKALDELGTYLSKADGRKLVVWIGPGWPIFDNPNVILGTQQQRHFFSGVVGLSTLLRVAGVTLYSVDPLGPLDAGSERTFLWESFTKPVTKSGRANPGNLALQVFAVHSGGTVQAGSNDINGSIARCAADATAWYSLAFDAQKADSPNAWHDVELKVDKPGVKVRTENGYYAQP